MTAFSKKQTFLICIVHFMDKNNINIFILQPVHRIQSHVTTSAQYPVTCYNQCTVPNHMLQPVYSIQSHFTTSAQYPITCSKLHTLPAKNCEAPRCVCTFYRPAHHMNWPQVLTPTLNITKYHMYMSTVVPAEVKCYITRWYCCTPEGISLNGNKMLLGTLQSL